MTAPTRLALFALAVVAAFGIGFGVGDTIGPDPAPAGEQRHSTRPAPPAGSHDVHEEMTEAEEGAGGHGAHGAEGDAKVVLEPGERGAVTHRFTEAGTFEIGCHEPGH